MAKTSSYLSHLKVQRRLPILLMKSAMNLIMILSGLQRSTAWQLQKDDQWSRGHQLARGRTSDLLPTLRTKKKGKNNKMLKPPDVTGTRKRPKHATKLKSPYFLARTNSLKEKSQNWKQNLKQ